MYIINNKGEIFNTDCICEITTDNVHVFAVWDGNPRTISYNVEALKTIADGLRNNASIVEVD